MACTAFSVTVMHLSAQLRGPAHQRLDSAGLLDGAEEMRDSGWLLILLRMAAYDPFHVSAFDSFCHFT